MGGWTATLSELSGLPVYNAGTGGESVNTIVSAFKIAVEAIEKLPASSGCGGSITATSIVLSGLALAAIALLTYKKVKEN